MKHHTRYDSSGRVISPLHKPLPDSTQLSQEEEEEEEDDDDDDDDDDEFHVYFSFQINQPTRCNNFPSLLLEV
jgi:hypothetical protein